MLSWSLNSLFEPRQVVVGDPVPERDEVAARLDAGVHVGTQLGPAPQHFTHVLAQALAVAAELAVRAARCAWTARRRAPTRRQRTRSARVGRLEPRRSVERGVGRPREVEVILAGCVCDELVVALLALASACSAASGGGRQVPGRGPRSARRPRLLARRCRRSALVISARREEPASSALRSSSCAFARALASSTSSSSQDRNPSSRAMASRRAWIAFTAPVDLGVVLCGPCPLGFELVDALPAVRRSCVRWPTRAPSAEGRRRGGGRPCRGARRSGPGPRA